MFTNEQDRVQRILANGRQAGERLEFDPRTGRVRVANHRDPDSSNLYVTPDHLGFSSEVR